MTLEIRTSPDDPSFGRINQIIEAFQPCDPWKADLYGMNKLCDALVQPTVDEFTARDGISEQEAALRAEAVSMQVAIGKLKYKLIYPGSDVFLGVARMYNLKPIEDAISKLTEAYYLRAAETPTVFIQEGEIAAKMIAEAIYRRELKMDFLAVVGEVEHRVKALETGWYRGKRVGERASRS